MIMNSAPRKASGGGYNLTNQTDKNITIKQDDTSSTIGQNQSVQITKNVVYVSNVNLTNFGSSNLYIENEMSSTIRIHYLPSGNDTANVGWLYTYQDFASGASQDMSHYFLQNSIVILESLDKSKISYNIRYADNIVVVDKNSNSSIVRLFCTGSNQIFLY